MSAEVAPSLSTAQGEDIFEFDRLKVEQIKLRPYLGLHDSNDRDALIKLLAKYYSIEELVEYLRAHSELKKITLQFPDMLVCDSSYVLQILQEKLNYAEPITKTAVSQQKDWVEGNDNGTNCDSGVCCGASRCIQDKNENGNKSVKTDDDYEVWILADTSYSSCCIDEVAAEHVGADVVIHFGDSCLNLINKLPSLFVFGKPYIDLRLLKNKLMEQYTSKDEKIMLMADTCYSYCLRDLYEEMKKEGYSNVIYCEVRHDKKFSESNIIGYPTNSIADFDSLIFIKDCKRYIMGLNEATRQQYEGELDALMGDYTLFHITMPESPKLLYLNTKFSSVTIYDPLNSSVSSGPFPSLMRRYRFMHVCRTAGTIGILVNTLSLNNTKLLSDVVAKWIKDADKKYYMFVVGKPNVAKLANFDAIDCWCILGCGQGGIVVDENNEYYKPIVTPYELHLALSPEVTWTGNWVVDFNDVLQMDEKAFSQETEKEATSGTADEYEFSEDEYAPEFSAVTGKYVSNSRPLRQVKHLQIELGNQRSTSDSEKQLVEKFSSQVLINGEASTSAMHLQNRQWTGLGSDYNNDDNFDESGAEIEEGILGIARGYDK